MVRFLLLATLMLAPAAAAVPSADSERGDAPWWPETVSAALDRSGERRAAWETALRAAPTAHRPGLAFLLEHMPEPDLHTLDAADVVADVALSYAAREAVPWGAGLPEELFLNDVLPYANVSERRDPWRAMLMERYLRSARECATPAEAALRLNAAILPELGVRYSTERARADQSPAESIESGLASCTGLSILLVDACRAVCVPARLAGIPNWIDDRGNHTWVEIWSDGEWHFVGAAEPDPQGLDHAWFTADAEKARIDEPEHAIYAISYRSTGLAFPLQFDETAPPVWAVNVTDRYAKAGAEADDETRLLVTATDAAGGRVAIGVTVRDPADATATFAGITHAGTHDLNDRLAFRLPRGRSYEVTARQGDATVTAVVAAKEAECFVAFVADGRTGVLRVSASASH